MTQSGSEHTHSFQDLNIFKLAVDQVSDHVIITDTKGVVVYANAAVEKTTGYSNKEIIGKRAGTVENWGGMMDRDYYQQLWKTVVIDKQTFIGEITNKRKNGQIYQAEVKISPIIDDKGEVIFVAGIERDITKAKEVDKMKTEFVALVSHQLRSPLSTIKWFLEILINGNLGKMTPKQEEVLKKIERSNQRMISLINSLLDISRIDSGKLEVNRQLTDMRILIREVIHDLESQLEENKQTIRIKIPSRLPEIFLDPQLIRQVFMNLLTNAIKYSPAGSTIKLTVVLKDGSLLCRIEDQGVGIPEHQQERVFEKFFRGENAAKLTVNGNGLGLYMVKKLIESSGGVIGFNSGGQKGSEFWFKLPVAN